MKNKRSEAELIEELNKSENPLPLLQELLFQMNTDDPGSSESIKSVILSHFDYLRESARMNDIDTFINQLSEKFTKTCAAADFLRTTREAYNLIVEESQNNTVGNVFNKMLRMYSGSYLFDGTQPSCPRCRSTRVREGDSSMYEFTDMICDECGNRQLADEYQLVEWYKQ